MKTYTVQCLRGHTTTDVERDSMVAYFGESIVREIDRLDALPDSDRLLEQLKSPPPVLPMHHCVDCGVADEIADKLRSGQPLDL